MSKISMPTTDFSVTELAQQATAEFARLQAQGVDVISHSITPSSNGKTIFTVSPWLADLAPCPDPIFETNILPNVSEYYNQALGALVLAKGELQRPGQYSVRPIINDQPLLHDVDPYLRLVAP